MFRLTNRLMHEEKLKGYRVKSLTDVFGKDYQFDVSLDVRHLLAEDFGIVFQEGFFDKDIRLLPWGDSLIPSNSSDSTELSYGLAARKLGSFALSGMDVGLKVSYNEYNRLYFGGLLPKNVLVMWGDLPPSTAGLCECSLRESHGAISYGQFVITLDRRYHQKRPDEVALTLIHEMIHVLHPASEHGGAFLIELERLNRSYGLNIPIYVDDVKKHDFCYRCVDCGSEYSQDRLMINTDRFFCGHRGCGGKLKLISEGSYFHTKHA